MRHACWGITADDHAIARALDGAGLLAQRVDEGRLVRAAADLLAEGRIVGWYQGRAEVGQRALGARSILADPRKRETLVRVNQLKGRESWRPVAPSVLEEYASDLFRGPLLSPSRFMLSAHAVRGPARRCSLPPRTSMARLARSS